MTWSLSLLLLLALGCSESGNDPVRPMLVPNPGALEFEAFFGSSAPNTYVQVGVDDIDTIEYRLSADKNWIDIPTGSRTAPDSFFIKVFSNDLQPGTSTGTITLTSTDPVGITRTIPVTVDIGSVIQVSPRFFSYVATRESTAIANQQFVVTTNDPIEDFGFKVEPLVPWITVPDDSGTTPDTVQFTIDLPQASVGNQTGRVRISSTDAANPPQLVTCTLSVFSWLEQESPFDKDLRSVHFYDNKLGWAVGILGGQDQSGYLIKTVDGGNTWQLYPELDFGFLQGLDFADASNGWAVGADGLIINTSNGGELWTEQTSGVTVDLWGVGFSSADSGIAIGRSGTVGYTFNGGSTWSFTSDIVSYNLTDISVIDNEHAWIVGNFGAILSTTDGGQSWTVVSLGTFGDLWSVKFVDRSTGWLVGEGGLILHTTDGGATWQTQTSNTDKTLLSAHFVDNSVGWLVGEEGTILHTTDGGQTWTPQYGGIDDWFLFDVFFVDQSFGWIVGQYGTILYSPSGGD
jgi:photosystem II stability/assembly factor-like uncharacterized protein